MSSEASRRARSVIAGALIACALSCSDPLGPRDFDGVWGADGARFTSSITLVRFESSCWAGDLTIPLIVDGDEFTNVGTLDRQGGAGMPESRLATFRGRLEGDVLHLSIEPASLGLGPYQLRRDRQVDIPGCP